MSASCLIRPCRLLAPLLALVLGVGWCEARAGLGVIVTETVLMPVEDPLTQFDFKLALVAGNQILQGDNITFRDIPFFNGTASYSFTSGGIDYSQFFSIRATQGSSAGLTDIALVLTASPGSLTNADPVNNISIGDLIVVTSIEYPPAPDSPLFNPIRYTTQTHLFPSGELNLGSGITAASAIVPEPASAALLGVGVGGVAAFLVARGRRNTARRT